MLKDDILELIIKKYNEIKELYSKSLEVTSRILLLLSEKEADELADQFEQRENAIFSAEQKLKEVTGLSKQYARDKFLKNFTVEELYKTAPEYASKIKKIRIDTVEIIKNIQKLDETLRNRIGNYMNEIKMKLQKVDVTKKMRKNYGLDKSSVKLIDKNI